MTGSSHWSQISKKCRTPAKAIWLVVVLSFLFALVDYLIKHINQNVAYTTIAFLTTISVVGLYMPYGKSFYRREPAARGGIAVSALSSRRAVPEDIVSWAKDSSFIRRSTL